jgi:hypothetical protein
MDTIKTNFHLLFFFSLFFFQKIFFHSNFFFLASIDPKFKETIKQKATEYMQRAEFVKAIVDQDAITQNMLRIFNQNNQNQGNTKIQNQNQQNSQPQTQSQNSTNENPKNQINSTEIEKPNHNNKSNSNHNSNNSKNFIDLVDDDEDEEPNLSVDNKKDNNQNIFEEIFSINQPLLGCNKILLF